MYRQEVLDCSEGVISGLLVGIVIGAIVVGGEAYNSRGLQEQQVGHLVPAVRVAGEEIALLVLVAHQVGPDLLQHADQAGAAGTPVEPDRQGCLLGLLAGLDEYVVDLAARHICLQVPRIECLVDHALG